MAWEYTDKTKQLFMDALASKPGTHLGEMKDYDAVGEDGSIVCGDAMKIYLKVYKDKVSPANDKIIKVQYQTFGCTSAIASSEALCALIEEKNLSPLDALNITNQDIVDYLGGLPAQKVHCSVMGAEALREAVKDWATKRGVDLTKIEINKDESHDDEGELVCRCFNHTDVYLKEKIQGMNLKSVDEVMNATKAGGGCGSCIDAPGGIRDLIKEVWGEPEVEELPLEQIITCNLNESIQKVIDETIRPGLMGHGGDIEIINIKGTNVYCTLKGACSSCAGAQMTLKNSVEKQLQNQVDNRITVIDV